MTGLRRGLSRAIGLVVLVLLALWFAAAQRTSRSRQPTARADSVLIAAEPGGPDVTVTRSDLAAPERDPARIAHLLSTRSAGTYLGEMLAAHDSVNFRWPDRSHAPMRVWVQSSDLAGFDPSWPALVREAFAAWADAGVPIFFSFTPDSARAEIHVTWVDRFESRMTGRTRWAHDQNGWIVGGTLQLALHQFDGPRLDTDAVRAIARHEVGHLIGLDHTADESNIMSARVRVTEMSEADRATARLVYQLPPGSLKARE